MALFPSRYLRKIISNSKIITKKGKYALDAVQNNPEVEGSLAYEIKRIEAEFAEKLNNAMKWKFIGMFDLESNIEKVISGIPDAAQEIWVLVGEKNDTQIYGGISTVIVKSSDHYANNRHILFLSEIRGATGVTLATGASVYYERNNLRITVRDIGTNFHISARAYYR